MTMTDHFVDLTKMVAPARSGDLSAPAGAPSEDGDLAAEGARSQLASEHEIEPCKIILSEEGFAALQRRLAKAGGYDPRVAKVLSTPAPWDKGCDKNSTSENQ